MRESKILEFKERVSDTNRSISGKVIAIPSNLPKSKYAFLISPFILASILISISCKLLGTKHS